MKSYLVSIVFALFSFSALAQKLNADKVPQVVKTNFNKAHPNASGKWEKEEGNFEVSFKESGKEMSCVIDAGGNILETETVIPASELPQAAKDYIKKNYAGVTIKEAAKIVKSNGEINYEAELKKKDLIFDSAGKFLKISEEKDDED